MNVVSQGPWRVASLLWQPRPGAFTLTVTCSASFELAPGESRLTKPSAEALVSEGDERRLLEPWGPVVAQKRKAEVIVVGHAHAPGGTPVRQLVPRVAVGDLDKVIQIRGDSWFLGDGSLTEPGLFARMSLGWDRAAGGPGTSNPAGMRMGSDAAADRWGRIPVPNLLPFGTVIATPSDTAEPIGFGPIRPDWPGRVERLYSQAGSWDPERWMDRPLPDDVDLAYFNVAPRDQLVDELTREDRIVLEHLHPRHPRLATYLRAPSPRATTRATGVEQSVPLVCDTLVIDADHGRAVLVWRGQLAIDHPERDGVVLVAAAGRAPAVTSTLPVHVAPPAAELPFRRERQRTVALPAPAPGERPAPALPFSPPRNDDVTETQIPAFRAAKPSLPFQSSPPPPPDDEPDEGVPTQRRMALAAEAALAPGDTAPSFIPPPLAAPAWLHAVPEPSRPPAPAPIWTPRPADEPPPLLGPLAHMTRPSPSPEPAAAPEPEPPPTPAPASKGPEEPGLPLEKYPLDRSAAITARIDRRPDKRALILEEEQLSSDVWEALDVHWRAAVDADVARGKKKLRAAYDEAYVGSLEAERGPITAAEYARLLIAAERGAAAPLLGELGLPPASTMRIRRVWLARTVKDPRAAEALRLALRAASED